ncbi:OLC1v1001537C1 [Oldenlandia corymbosa var. corymbosa]|uniref:OLC1v1001537C1 n=1 Tax=Oldenlandia corymbosa var. corymbosa TaxID=529605 RepID=A0AAV1D5P2_OLDCO|nr:OLC1v1001537C1 [Oldenlandia corymbosa var. corymbosa]
MEGNREMEVHYMNTGFPYNGSEGYMDFFGGLPQAPLYYAQPPPMPHDHVSTYWSMNMNSNRFGISAPENTSYYGSYTINDEMTRMDYNRRVWEYPSVMNIEEPTVVDMPSEEIEVPTMQAIPEESHSPESTFSQQDGASSQAVWEDDIDPDNMTYEELLDLGEAVGSESRGLSQDLIDLLPTSKFKSGGIFSRKKSAERCVICQMRYKRGDRQINLPCKHVYHATCGSKWLSINKTCPVCNSEVFKDESRQ